MLLLANLMQMVSEIKGRLEMLFPILAHRFVGGDEPPVLETLVKEQYDGDNQ